MNHWQKREKAAALEQSGVVYESKLYPGWTFKFYPVNSWSRPYAQAMVRVSEQPELAAYLKRTRDANYEPVEGDDALDRRLLVDTFAEGSLFGWEGVTDETGAAMPFDRDNARKLLRHFRDLFHELSGIARDPLKALDVDKAALAAGN